MGELLQNGGFLPQLAQLQNVKAPWFSRKNGLIFTALWFTFWVMMMPSFFALADEPEAAAVAAVFGVFSTIMLLIISLALLKRPAPKSFELPASQMHPDALYGNPAMSALPPQQSMPVSTYVPPEGSWRAADTGDLAKRPGSVTEGTTKLLKKDE